MPQTDTQSLQQIKRQTEQTRAGLTDTVEQLRTSVVETASDIRQRISPDAMEKLLAVRADWAEENPDVLLRLVRAHRKAADFIEDIANREEVSAILAAPNRIDVAAQFPTASCMS